MTKLSWTNQYYTRIEVPKITYSITQPRDTIHYTVCRTGIDGVAINVGDQFTELTAAQEAAQEDWNRIKQLIDAESNATN